MKDIFTVFTIAIALIASIAAAFLLAPDIAYADITVGNQTIHGYQPNEMIQSDTNLNITADNAASKLETILVELVKTLLPILCVACVAKIIYSAVSNLFKKEEDRIPIASVVKHIFEGFFWIIFSWLIVELIVYVVTGGETWLYGLIFS